MFDVSKSLLWWLSNKNIYLIVIMSNNRPYLNFTLSQTWWKYQDDDDDDLLCDRSIGIVCTCQLNTSLNADKISNDEI